MLKYCTLILSLLLVACSRQQPPAEPVAAAIPIKVVIVTMFESGEDSGDKAGEFQR